MRGYRLTTLMYASWVILGGYATAYGEFAAETAGKPPFFVKPGSRTTSLSQQHVTTDSLRGSGLIPI